MRLDKVKKLAKRVAKSGTSRVKISSEGKEKLKEAITAEDIRLAIKEGSIEIVPKKGVSRSKGREHQQKRKQGRQRGKGKKRGTFKTRSSARDRWIERVRSQREHILKLKADKKLDQAGYRTLYRMVKGNYFKSKAAIDGYISEKLADRLTAKNKK